MSQLLFKRTNKDCVSNAEVDTCSSYTSVFLTTGVPVIISVSLFTILGIILFVIVRRKRKQRHAEEARKNREIDDDIGDVEMVITGPRNPDQAYKHWEARGASPHLEELDDDHDPFGQQHQQQHYQQGHGQREEGEKWGSRDVSPVKR